MSTVHQSRLRAWIDHVFDHPTAEDTREAWYWADDAPEWDWPAEEIIKLVADIFENSGELLAGFSDAQLDQGFWYLMGHSPPGFMEILADQEIAVEDRIRAVRAFTPLFEQVMAIRCSPRLSHIDGDAGPLNSSCYMWWDLFWHDMDLDFDDAPILAEIFEALRRQLTIPHDACRESALHGIGHWVRTIPQAAGLVDEFLEANPGLRPELVEYAHKARAGQVL